MKITRNQRRYLARAARREKRGESTRISRRTSGQPMPIASHAKWRMNNARLVLWILPTLYLILVAGFIWKIVPSSQLDFYNEKWKTLPFFMNIPFMLKLVAGTMALMVQILVRDALKTLQSIARDKRLWKHVELIIWGDGPN